MDLKLTDPMFSESDNTYHTLVENSIQGIAIIQGDPLRFVFANSSLADFFGYPINELTSLPAKRIEDLVHAEDRVMVLERLAGCLEGKSVPSQYEFKGLRRDGTIFWLELSANRIGFKGQPAVQASFIDVTERKKAKGRLKESEEKYQTTFEASMDALMILDEKRFLDCNKSTLLLFKCKSVEEFTKHHPSDLSPPTQPDGTPSMKAAMSHINRAFKTGTDHFFWIHTRMDGVTFPADVLLTRMPLKDQFVLQATVRDVTELKKMEESLKEKMDVLEAATENIGAGLTIISKDYRILWMNKYLKQFGFTTEKPCYSTFNRSEAVCSDCGVKRVFEGAPFDSREYFNQELHDKGLPPWFEIIATPIKDKDGNVKSALELTVNITEKKLPQQKLAEYSQELEKLVGERTSQLEAALEQLVKAERLAAIGQVAAMVGHDLRNPLTGISGAAYYLKMKLGPNAEKKMIQMLELIENDIQYSNKIITDLMDYSRGIQLELTETTPKSIVAESISLVEIPEKVQVINATQDMPRIILDIDKMKRVFANFIKNAVEAMPQGGKLAISSRPTEGGVEFTFIDSGVGMTKEVLDKIWTPFFTTKAKGMGLGLAICRRIIDAHQGKVSVESRIDEGTTFTITFPIELKSPASNSTTVKF